MTWNILEGLFIKDDGDERIDDIQRRKSAQSLVSDINPDILILNEALHCQEYFGLKRNYGHIFGYSHALGSLYDKEWGNVILSKFPIIDEVNMLIYTKGSRDNRGALAANILSNEGEIWVSTFHPHPKRRAFKRANDIDLFLERLNGPKILCGDLNAINPEDNTNREELIAGFERFSPPGEAAISAEQFIESGRMLFDDVLPRFNMHDAIPIIKRTYTIPTKLLSEDLRSSMRIDHMLVDNNIQVIDGYVVHDERADIASDHYPVVIEIALKTLPKK